MKVKRPKVKVLGRSYRMRWESKASAGRGWVPTFLEKKLLRVRTMGRQREADTQKEQQEQKEQEQGGGGEEHAAGGGQRRDGQERGR